MKKLAGIILFFFAASFFYAQETTEIDFQVNADELENTGGENIHFDNYGGPYDVIESAASIKGIGENLGRVIALDLFTPATVEPFSKYSLIHAVNPSNKEKLSADILILNENAAVDHIDNVRRILTGYLEQAYGYTEEEAKALAVFITVYNAVYRGDMENFLQKYDESVLQHLSEEKTGLSTDWQNWAGKSQIVIPLGNLSEQISSIDTTTISDEKVIEAIRQTEDKGIESREELTEIKEKEASAAAENAKEAQKEAAQQKKEGNKEEAKKAAKESSEQQKIADRKKEEVKKEKEEILKDKKIIEVQKEEDYITGLFLSDEKNGFYQLVTLDSVTGKIIRKSPLTQIRNKSIYIVENVTIETLNNQVKTFEKLYLAICGINDGHSALRLCLIDPDRLELQKQSSEILCDSIELIKNGNDFITVINDDKNYKIALYDKNLSLKAKSKDSVQNKTVLNLTSKGLLVTAADKSPLLLDAKNLESVWSKGFTNVYSSGKEK